MTQNSLSIYQGAAENSTFCVADIHSPSHYSPPTENCMASFAWLRQPFNANGRKLFQWNYLLRWLKLWWGKRDFKFSSEWLYPPWCPAGLLLSLPPRIFSSIFYFLLALSSSSPTGCDLEVITSMSWPPPPPPPLCEPNHSVQGNYAPRRRSLARQFSR